MNKLYLILLLFCCSCGKHEPELLSFHYEIRPEFMNGKNNFKNISEINFNWSEDTLFLNHILFVKNTCVNWKLETDYSDEIIQLNFVDKDKKRCELASVIQFDAIILFDENDLDKKIIYSGTELKRN